MPKVAAPLHPRGVYHDVDHFPGIVVLRVYDCSGTLMLVQSMSEQWYSSDMDVRLHHILAMHCPDAAHPPHPLVSAQRAGAPRLALVSG